MVLSTHAKGVVSGVLAVVVGAPTFVLVRVLGHSRAWTQLACRTPPFLLVVGGCALHRWGSVGRLVRMVRGVGLLGLLASVCAAAQSIAIVVALLLTSASNVALIINTTPLFCALSDALWLREPVPRRTVAMIAAGLLGVGLVLGGDARAAGRQQGGGGDDRNTGNLVALLNPVSWTGYWSIMRLRERNMVAARAAAAALKGGGEGGGRTAGAGGAPPRDKWDDILAFQLISGACVGLCGLAGGVQPSTVRRPDDLLWYALYGGLILPACFVLFSLAPTFIPTAEMGCIKMLETVLCPFLVWLYDGDSPTRITVIGGAIIVCAIGAHSFAALRADNEQRAAAAAAGGGESGAAAEGGAPYELANISTAGAVAVT